MRTVFQALAIGAVIATASVVLAGDPAPDFFTDTTVVRPTPQPQLAPLLFAEGNWRCIGLYHEVPPFTTNHTNAARFMVRVGVGGAALVGEYEEKFDAVNNQAPTSVHEVFGFDGLNGDGFRTFTDSRTGRLTSTMTVTASGIEWVGTYLIAGTPFPFAETLVRGPGDQSFSTDSKILNPFTGQLQTFHTQTCFK